MLELNKNKNYTLDLMRKMVDATESYEKKTDEGYMDALEKVYSDWKREYGEVKDKANSISKARRKCMRREDTCNKVIKRNPTYKSLLNISFALNAANALMLLIIILNCFFNFLPRREPSEWRVILIVAWITIIFYWEMLLYPGYYSSKYGFKLSRKDDKWENLYFKCFSDLLNADAYIDEYIKGERNLQKYFKVFDKYSNLVDDYKELTDKYNKVLTAGQKVAKAYEAVSKQKDDLLKENLELLRQNMIFGD